MKHFSVKTKILAIAIVPSLIIAVALLITGVSFMKSGMEGEVIKGLLSSAYTYKDIGVQITDRDAGDNDVETSLKQSTGYDFTWFDGDSRKNSSLGSSVIGTKAADTVIKAVINGGNSFTSTNTQVAGEPYFVAYVPVKDASGKVAAMAFTGVSRAAVQAQIMKSIIVMCLIGVVLMVLTIAVATYASMGMSNAIAVMNDSISHLAKGEFKKSDKYLDRKDDIGVALNNTNALVTKLEEIVTGIRESATLVGTSSEDLSDMANQISQTAEDVSTAVQEIASGATQQADEIQNAAENVGLIGEAVGNVQTSTGDLDTLAGKMKEASEVSSSSLTSLKDASTEMTEKIDEISNAIQRTQDAVTTISSKVEGITSIATQTNLLSLNASIEAARAGEAGKGFAVVAGEIGKLAEDSRTMADEIRKEMEVLLEESNAAVHAADDVRQGNLDQQSALEGTIDSINGMLEDINSTVGGVHSISRGADQCESSKNAVVDTMSALSAISQENAASSEETGASMQELSATVTMLASNANNLKKVAEELNQDIAFFK
ncbi:methyl-accepting chemotaxis protein [Butyrivibrio sp. AE3006]|uniref:methyl-accepting chemotaxis protein n=1 Tax=Butyrivibrio sp. AE3006 TaxID=1280673 RepID=UPI0003F5BE18|nr:methyl-accepting chemotaxis protein [Butyrivibrio sp. AE3006]